MSKKVKVIYEDIKYISIRCFEDEVQQFIEQRGIEVIDIKYSHAEVVDDDTRTSSTSFSAMIIYREI